LELANATLASKDSAQEQSQPSLNLPDDPLERGRIIRKLRVERGINQMVFADLVGIRFSRYTAIEGGAEKPTPQMLKRIARELNCQA
jgi:DNA-binding XRE family transcriptional regulator